MSVVQALAIAAAAWVTAAAADPSMTTIFHQTHAQANHFAARFERAASTGLRQIEGGFSATPDGVRMEREAALR